MSGKGWRWLVVVYLEVFDEYDQNGPYYFGPFRTDSRALAFIERDAKANHRSKSCYTVEEMA